MASRTRRLLALAALVWTAATAGKATTFATTSCRAAGVTVSQSLPVSAQCSNTQFLGSLPGVEISATGEASADLRTGALKSRGVGQAYQSGSEDWDASGGSTAELQDTITIGGGFTGTVEIRMEVSGSFLMSDPSFGSGNPQMGVLLQMYNPSNPNVGNSQASLFVNQPNCSSCAPGSFAVLLANPFITGTGTFSTNADPTGIFWDPADVRVVLTTTVAVTPSNPTFTFHARLFTAAGVNSLADTNGEIKTSELNFGNSAYLSLILPAGVPWTSESGAFLQGVPEPGMGALLVASMLGLVGVRRVRARTAR